MYRKTQNVSCLSQKDMKIEEKKKKQRKCWVFKSTHLPSYSFQGMQHVREKRKTASTPFSARKGASELRNEIHLKWQCTEIVGDFHVNHA